MLGGGGIGEHEARIRYPAATEYCAGLFLNPAAAGDRAGRSRTRLPQALTAREPDWPAAAAGPRRTWRAVGMPERQRKG